MWYGYKRTPNFNKILKNRSYRANLRDRRAGYPLLRRSIYPSTSFRFQMPASWKFIMVTSVHRLVAPKLIYAYNNLYFLNFVLLGDNTQMRYDAQTRTMQFKSFTASYTYLWYLKTLTNLFSRFHKPFFSKIKFKGKGYYMYKNHRNTIAPQFGYAHRVYVYCPTSTVKFLSKTKVLLFGLSKADILQTSHDLYKTRPMNIFTGRGVRFARQVVYKKTGKVGAYR